ncbi:MAG: histone deacetylase [Rhodothermaceae bacterium]|nr:histone deacetylase [Rhodothermaceae bacterium]
MRVSYHADYYVPLPPRHAFPMGKFPALHRLLVDEGLIELGDVVEPREVDWSDLLLVHTREYLSALASGRQTRHEERRMGLPWSEALVRRSRLAVQGTVNAALMALHGGLAGNLAGGTHHAMPGHAEGFCVLNDVAVAIRVLQQSGWLRRALIVDLDVHQGNGNAAFFADRPTVYTFSMHGAKNYPFQKPPSSRDVALPDGTTDEIYLETLRQHLPSVLDAARPDLVFYLGGIDVLAGDRFGRLALTPTGVAARDRYVAETVYRAGIPLCLLLSGGYAETPTHTAVLHASLYREAHEVFEGVLAED